MSTHHIKQTPPQPISTHFHQFKSVLPVYQLLLINKTNRPLVVARLWTDLKEDIDHPLPFLLITPLLHIDQNNTCYNSEDTFVDVLYVKEIPWGD